MFGEMFFRRGPGPRTHHRETFYFGAALLAAICVALSKS